MSSGLIEKLKASPSGLKAKQGFVYWTITPECEGLWRLDCYAFSQRSNSMKVIFSMCSLDERAVVEVQNDAKIPVRSWEAYSNGA